MLMLFMSRQVARKLNVVPAKERNGVDKAKRYCKLELYSSLCHELIRIEFNKIICLDTH